MTTHNFALATRILQKVQKLYDPDALIAGGWVRDYLLERDSKDIDVWFYTEDHPMAVYKRLRYHLDDATGPWLCLVSEGEGWGRFVIKATIQGHAVDFIGYHCPVGKKGAVVLEHFDFGICMVGWSPEHGFIITDEFTRDATRKLLTFYAGGRDREDLQRVVHDHLPRLRNKFEHYVPVNIPQGVEPYGGAKPNKLKVIYSPRDAWEVDSDFSVLEG